MITTAQIKTSLDEKPIINAGELIESCITELKQNISDANNLRHINLKHAISILLEDALKWKKEADDGKVDLLDASFEISCLHHIAEQEIINGEENCKPDVVRTYLTV